MKTTAILVSLFCFILASCGSDDHNGGGNGQDGDYNLQEEIRKILNSTKATKILTLSMNWGAKFIVLVLPVPKNLPMPLLTMI